MISQTQKASKFEVFCVSVELKAADTRFDPQFMLRPLGHQNSLEKEKLRLFL